MNRSDLRSNVYTFFFSQYIQTSEMFAVIPQIILNCLWITWQRFKQMPVPPRLWTYITWQVKFAVMISVLGIILRCYPIQTASSGICLRGKSAEIDSNFIRENDLHNNNSIPLNSFSSLNFVSCQKDSITQKLPSKKWMIDRITYDAISVHNRTSPEKKENYKKMSISQALEHIHVRQFCDEKYARWTSAKGHCRQNSVREIHFPRTYYNHPSFELIESDFNEHNIHTLEMLHSRYGSRDRRERQTSVKNSSESISLLQSGLFSPISQKKVVVIQRPDIADHQKFTVNQVETESSNVEQEAKFPVLSFQYVEPHTIELLVVVTEKMRQRFGTLLNDYLASTMTTVSSLLRHPSLSTSIKLNIVDVILLDRTYASHHNLEDWSYSKQEQVMAKFCRWVNRLKRPNFNWDSAILLNVGHFKSTALGVAHYRSMCSEESACLAVLDRGFGTGYIIAHELGHQLGAKHDFERDSSCGMQEQAISIEPKEPVGNMFGTIHRTVIDEDYDRPQTQPILNIPEEIIRRDTLMSGTLYFDNFPLRWSACSRKAIHNFLESNMASCLRTGSVASPLHDSDWLAKRLQHDLPGAIFSLDQQCQFVLKVHNTRFCGEMLPICRQLYCEDPENGACLPMEAAWAEGSTCGEDMWCLQGQCVPQSQKPVRIDGNWGEWGPWSSCSRPCGGGVRFSERECNNPEPQNGGSFCHGTRTRMRSCAVQPCKEANNIRQQLCDIVGKQYGSALEAYIPKIGETSACSLTCLDGVQAVPHRIDLPDGTPCYAQRDDICIKGRCWETGCDRVLGSTMRFDRCRVCGGDNSTCTEIKGQYDGSLMRSFGGKQRSLITAVRIPRGVTNAYVRKKSSRRTPYSSDSYDDYMLLIFEELKTQIRRGETREPFAGAELYYSGSRHPEEIVIITGRLQKEVNIAIRVENPKTTRPLPLVEYQYYVDKSEQDNPLYFVAEQEAQQAVKMAKMRFSRSRIMSSKLLQTSSSTNNKLSAETRQRPRLHFVWRISDLPSGCSNCAGTTTSHAECYPSVEDEQMRKLFNPHDFYRPVADYLCASIPRPPPIVRQCADYCGVRWAARPLIGHNCSVRCGEGTQPAVHVCEEFIVPAEQRDKSKGLWRESQVGKKACIIAGLGDPPSKPDSVSCRGNCQPVFWFLSNWSECSGSCSHGEHHRQLSCQEADGTAWPLAECYVQTQYDPDSANPEGAISNELADEILSAHGDSIKILQTELTIKQYEPCLSLSDCVNDIHWTTSAWSECELQTDEQRTHCRSIDELSSSMNSLELTGMRSRSIHCELRTQTMHSSLKQYALNENAVRPPWPMKLEFCHLVRTLVSFPAKPPSTANCENPYCYRWGRAKVSDCSASCGRGQRSVTIPCERITFNPPVTATNQVQPNYAIEQVSVEFCQTHFAYVPRLLMNEDNSTIHVETPERPYKGQNGMELKVTDFGEPLNVECSGKPCTMEIPVWHTTAWDKCSVSCGPGVRRRNVVCLLETRLQSQALRPSFWLQNNVLTSRRLNFQVTEEKRCLDAGLSKPVLEEPCDEGPCPHWSPDAWGECEGICEYGIQRRNIRCLMKMAQTRQPSTSPPNDLSQALIFSVGPARPSIRRHRSLQFKELPIERCQDAGPKPITQRLCLLSRGCPFWTSGQWSSCSVECGTGKRHRTVSCRFPNATLIHNPRTTPFSTSAHADTSVQGLTQWVEQNSQQPGCLDPRPVETRTCKTRPCRRNQAFWWPVMTSECDSTSCSIGRRNRVVICMSSTKGPVPESQCHHLTKPSQWTPCIPQHCMKFQWVVDPWTPCPKLCGTRSKYRKVRCMDAFGEEYSDSLCPGHLKPDNWRICPNPCNNKPRSCTDVKQQYPDSRDGTYEIAIEFALVSIYCADMHTDNPKEYITLRQVNFAKSAGFLQPNSNSFKCPMNSNSTVSAELSSVPREIDTTEPTAMHQFFYDEVTTVNCPDCPFIPSLASVTYYDKIRLELSGLRIDVEDTRFTYTVGPSPIPYGTSKDCFGSAECPQGRFQIDLRGTGFQVDVQTLWSSANDDSAVHIHRAEHGQVIKGHCGGRCSGCWPRPDLLVQVLNDGVG